MNTNFRIAKTHLLAKKRQTLVAVLGVTFGIAMYVLMASVMTGVNKFVDELSFQVSPHIRLYKEADVSRKSILDEQYGQSDTLVKVWHQKPKPEKLYIKSISTVLEQLRNDPDVTGVSAQVSSAVFFNYGPVQFAGTLQGVNILDEDRLFDLRSKMQEGRLEDLLTVSNGLLMGYGLAQKMSVGVGDNVAVTTPRGQTLMLKVSGIFRTGLGAIDNGRSYADLKTVQRVLQKDKTYITDLNIKVRDIYQAKQKSAEYASRYGVTAEDWETANSTFQASNKIRLLMTYIVSLTMLIVAGFGIYNIMSMTVNNKLKDIAILKATGFSGGDIVRIFLTQAGIIGLMGALLGVVIGFGFSYLVSLAPLDGGEFISLDHFPVNFSPLYYAIGVVFGLITTVLAGYSPAKKASKIDPVAILRG
jgi:lipoprotein-releasing system permease protein